MKMAEREGFEPSVRAKYPYDGLANRCLQPLGHLSKIATILVKIKSNNGILLDY